VRERERERERVLSGTLHKGDHPLNPGRRTANVTPLRWPHRDSQGSRIRVPMYVYVGCVHQPYVGCKTFTYTKVLLKKNRVPEGFDGKHIPFYTHSSSESSLFSLSAATSSSTSRTSASLSTSSSTSHSTVGPLQLVVPSDAKYHAGTRQHWSAAPGRAPGRA
jgi:hypothetical protein